MKQREWLFIVIVFAIPFLVYLPTLSGWFLTDDYGFYPIFKMSIKDIMQGFQMVHDGELRLHPFRPVAIVSLWIDYHIWGWNSFGFHFTNTLLHSCNTILIYFLLRTLKISQIASLIAALFFGLYPAHSEAVVWISCRFDLLAQFLFLLSLLCWINGRKQENNRLLILSALTYLLSLFTKETVAGGIILFPLIDWLFLWQKPNSLKTIKFWLGWIGIQISMLIILILTRLWLFGSLSGDIGGTRGLSFLGTSLMECLQRLQQDLWMMLTPVSRIIFTDSTVIIVGIFISTIFLWAIYGSLVKLRNQEFTLIKLLLLGIVWIFTMIIPVLFINPVASSLDCSRFLYIPCTGLALIVGISVETIYSFKWIKRLSKWVFILFTIWFLISIAILYQYNNNTWVEAGKVIKGVDQVLFDNTQDIQDNDTIIVINLPRSWKGAQFAPNGYAYYLQGIHHKKHLNLVYVEKYPMVINSVWLNDLQQAYSHRYYVFVWNSCQQTLEPLQ